jgi:hypothetical protein
MKFTSITTLASIFLVSASSTVALPVHAEVRDVFVPPILYPRAGTVWKVGEKHRISWFVIHFMRISVYLTASLLGLRPTIP